MTVLRRAEVFEAYALADRAKRHLRINFVSSADGASALDGSSGGLGNDDDRLIMGVLRAMSDVILVGSGTVRVEGYGGIRLGDENRAWRAEQGLPADPPLAIVSSSLSIEPDHQVFGRATARPYVITHAAAPLERRVRLGDVAEVILAGEDRVIPSLALDALAERGHTQVLCEGGPQLFGTLLGAGLVDELCLTLSPTLVAGETGRIAASAEPHPTPLALASVLRAEDTLFLRYHRA